MTIQELQTLSKQYNSNPDSFSDEDVYALQQQHQEAGIPFVRIQSSGDRNLMNSVEQAVNGFVEGLTTIDPGWGGKAQGSTESIIHSIGSVLGFMGMLIPGAGEVGRGIGLGIGAVARGLEATTLLSDSARMIEWGSKVGEVIATGGRIKSVPMFAADWLAPKIGTMLDSPMAQAFKFLEPGLARTSIDGAVHLGIAGFVSGAPITDTSLPTIVNQRLSGLVHMGLFGAGQSAMGELIAKGGKWDMSKLFGIEDLPAGTLEIAKGEVPGDSWSAQSVMKDYYGKITLANNMAKAVTGAIVLGGALPIITSGGGWLNQPISMQVYDLVLNGMFGAMSKSKDVMKGEEIFSKMYNNPEGQLNILNAMHDENFLKDEPQGVRDHVQTMSLIELGNIGKMITADGESKAVTVAGEHISTITNEMLEQNPNIDLVRTYYQKVEDKSTALVEGGGILDAESLGKINKESHAEVTSILDQQNASKRLNVEGLSIFDSLKSQGYVNTDEYNANGLASMQHPLRKLAESLADTTNGTVDEIERGLFHKAVEFLGQNPKESMESDWSNFKSFISGEPVVESTVIPVGAEVPNDILPIDNKVQHVENLDEVLTHKRGYHEFYISTGEKSDPSYTRVSGKVVEIPGSDKSFFLHKENVGYSVSEVESGSRIGKGKLQKEAITNAIENHTKFGGDKGVDEAIAKQGIQVPGIKKTLLVTPGAILGDVKVPTEHENLLRQVFLNLHQVRKELYQYNDITGQVERSPVTSLDYSKDEQFGFKPWVERNLVIPGKGKVWLLNKVIFEGEKGKASGDIMDRESTFNFVKTIKQMYNDGMAFLGGIKTKTTQAWVTSLLDDPMKLYSENQEVLDLLKNQIGFEPADLDKPYSGGKTPTVGDILKAGFERFKKGFETKETELAKDIFLKHSANMIKYLVKINNGISIKDQFEGKGRFTKDVIALTKRNQILFAPETAMNGEFFKPYGIKDLGDDGFKYTIVRAYNTGAIIGGQDKNSFWVYGKDGKPEIKYSDVIRDGGKFWRNDVFDATADFAGQSRKAGFLKGTAVITDANGLEISKMANHRASADMDAWLHENNLHYDLFPLS